MTETDAGSDDAALEAQRAASYRIPLHELLGLEYEPPPEGATYAEVHLPVRPAAFGFTANLHGGAIATMIDVACALAAARGSGFDPMKQSLVTADMHVRYLGRPRSDRVTAKAQVVKVGRQLIVVECKVVDGTSAQDGREHVIAAADFSSMIVPLRGPLAPGLADEREPEPGDPEL